MPLFLGSSAALVMIHVGDAWPVTRTNSLHKRRYLSVPVAHSGIHYLPWRSNIVEKQFMVCLCVRPRAHLRCISVKNTGLTKSVGSPKLGLRIRATEGYGMLTRIHHCTLYLVLEERQNSI